MFPCITSLLIKLQRCTVSQMKALNKLIILYFIKKMIWSENKGAAAHRTCPIQICLEASPLENLFPQKSHLEVEI